jgi:hypothetical protein
MTLFDAQPPKPERKFGRYILIAVALAMIAGVCFVAMKNYPEEQAVSKFLTALQQGQYRDAYQLWQPSKSYVYDDFLHDWGEHGDYGKIRNFRILGSRSKGKASVIVFITINDVTPPAEILVDRKSRGLAYSPY